MEKTVKNTGGVAALQKIQKNYKNVSLILLAQNYQQWSKNFRIWKKN